MIPARTVENARIGLFGLGGSGRATFASLKAGGAHVLIGDDDEASIERLLPQADGRLTRDTDFAVLDALVLAPGVPLTHPEPHWSALAAKAAGVDVIGDLEIFARERAATAPDAPLVCVTGTNGKSTTTALVAHLLAAAGRDVAMGGNIGVPALELPPAADGRVHVIECSSYQIDLAPSLAPTIGVHLNLSADHIDRHGTFENYAAIKERLIALSSTAVVGIDDAPSAAIADRAEARGQTVRRIGAASPGLTLDDAPALRGAHNAQNAAAAIAVTRTLGLTDMEIAAGLVTFPGLAHRMERVAEIGGVLFVNDSKATNAAATANALKTYPHIFWIVGGRAKADGIDPLQPWFDRIEKAYLIGESTERFSKTLQGVRTESCGTLEVAVSRAADDAAASTAAERVVLLSPACASFDQFASFEARGAAFVELVTRLPQADAKGMLA